MGIELGHQHDLAVRIDALEDAVRNLSTQDILQNASIGAGGLTVDGTGGITVTGGGSLTITGTGTLNVASGGLNSAGSISAGTTITAGGNITSTGGDLSGVNVHASANVTATGNVVAGGQVQSNGSPFMSQPSYNYVVTTSYLANWIDGVTYQIGHSSSTPVVKTALAPMTAADADRLLSVVPYWGRYVWDDPASPLKAFLLAPDVQAAGFGPDVAPVVTGEPMHLKSGPAGDTPVLDANGAEVVIPVGEAFTINYSQIVVPLLAVVREQRDQIAALEARLKAAGIA